MMSRVICWMRSQCWAMASRALRLLFELLEVVTGTERPSGTGEHNGTRSRIVLRLHQRIVQIQQQVTANGVEALRPIQGDNADLTLGLVQCKFHGKSLTLVVDVGVSGGRFSLSQILAL
jgi:hypothetical protein